MLDFTSALVAAAGSEELQQQVGMLKDGADMVAAHLRLLRAG
jgi:hypothetical protein